MAREGEDGARMRACEVVREETKEEGDERWGEGGRLQKVREGAMESGI